MNREGSTTGSFPMALPKLTSVGGGAADARRPKRRSSHFIVSSSAPPNVAINCSHPEQARRPKDAAQRWRLSAALLSWAVLVLIVSCTLCTLSRIILNDPRHG